MWRRGGNFLLGLGGGMAGTELSHASNIKITMARRYDQSTTTFSPEGSFFSFSKKTQMSSRAKTEKRKREEWWIYKELPVGNNSMNGGGVCPLACPFFLVLFPSTPPFVWTLLILEGRSARQRGKVWDKILSKDVKLNTNTLTRTHAHKQVGFSRWNMPSRPLTMLALV